MKESGSTPTMAPWRTWPSSSTGSPGASPASSPCGRDDGHQPHQHAFAAVAVAELPGDGGEDRTGDEQGVGDQRAFGGAEPQFALEQRERGLHHGLERAQGERQHPEGGDRGPP